MSALLSWIVSLLHRGERATAPGARLLLLLSGIAFVSSAFVIGSLVERADADANRNAARTIAGAIERERSRIGHEVVANARWDEAAAHVYGTMDRRWMQSNYGTPTGLIFVIDSRGRTIFAHVPGGGTPSLAAMIPPRALNALLARLPATEAEARRRDAVSLATRFGGAPALIAMMPIVHESGPATLDRASFYILIDIVPFNRKILADWSKAFSLPDLRYGSTVSSAEPTSSTELTDWDGRRIATISWRSLAPGRDAFHAILPTTIVFALLFLAVSIMLIRQVTRLNRDLEAKSRSAERAAAEQEEARLLAERALEETRLARRDGEQQSRRRIAAEEQHRAELKAASHAIADRLQASIGALVANLHASATELDQSADHALTIIHEQHRQAETAYHVSDRTAEATCAMLETMRALAETVERVGTEAEASAQMAIEAARHSASAQTANETLVHSVSSIEQAADRIASLSRATNLLALNATIEAARAGEFGRGFAVVAQEVKSFSQQTAGTTGAIVQCVKDIGLATTSAVTISDTLRVALDALAASARQTIAITAQQHNDSADIRHMIGAIETSTSTAREALTSITGSFRQTAAAANQTRGISAEMRARTEALHQECARIVDMLRAA